MQHFNKVIITKVVHINDNKLLIITEPKTIYFDVKQDVVDNLKHEIDFIIKQNDFLADHTIKNEISRILSKHKHGNYNHQY